MGELERKETGLCRVDTAPPSLDLDDLEAHFLQCEHCDADICFFDLLLSEAEEEPEIEAPDGFEYAVMTRIVHMKGNRFALEVRVWDKARRSLVGTILLCLGAGTVYIIFREPIWAQLPRSQDNVPLSLVDTLKAPGTSTNVLSRSAKVLLGLLGVITAFHALWKRHTENEEDE